MALGWRAYYADGSTIDSTEVRPEQLPDNAVGVVEFLKPPYRRVLDGGDWYPWDGEHWDTVRGADNGEWRERPDALVALKSAPSLPDDEWERIQKRMLADRDWP